MADKNSAVVTKNAEVDEKKVDVENEDIVSIDEGKLTSYEQGKLAIENEIGLSDDGEDLALKYADENFRLTPEMDRRLRRKADLYLLPFMAVVYAVQFMDKVSNSAASVMNLRTDLKMDGNMYAWVGSSFYLGYLVFELPVSWVLQRFPLAKATSVIIVLWGTVLACSGASQNYAGFITCRVLMGALEGAVTPSFMIVTSQWYKRDEQYSRVLLWFAANGVGSALAGAIAYGLYANHSLPIKGWRLLFIIFGVITIVLGIAYWFHIPDTPESAWFLSHEERVAQVERIRQNKQGFGSRKFKVHQIWEALRDPRTYLYFCIVFLAQVPNGGLTNFQTIIMTGLGFSSGTSILMSIPSGGAQIVGSILVAIISIKFFPKNRMVLGIATALLTIMTLAFLAFGINTGMKLSGLFLYQWLAPCAYVAMLSCVSSNSAGHTKKLFTSAVLLIGYCVGNLIGPQTFKASETPNYQTAKTSMVGTQSASTFLICVLTALNVWTNKRRDRKNEKLPSHIKNPEFADLTDFENPEFRYAL